MQQHEIRSPKGATHKRKRVGRGNASGHGTYSTRGMKGQKSRAGGGVRPGFEGGQLPFVRRMAYKRGFRNAFRVDYEEVNVGDLGAFAAGAEVNRASLESSRIVRGTRPIKILGEGDLSVALTVEADSFSKSAREKIEGAGGSVRWLNGEPQPKPEGERKPNSVGARKRRAKVAEAAAEKARAAAKSADEDGGGKSKKKGKQQEEAEPAEAEEA
jgi:large subunit ribosomal protein L15